MAKTKLPHPNAIIKRRSSGKRKREFRKKVS
jgi:hypothetical protein